MYGLRPSTMSAARRRPARFWTAASDEFAPGVPFTCPPHAVNPIDTARYASLTLISTAIVPYRPGPRRIVEIAASST